MKHILNELRAFIALITMLTTGLLLLASPPPTHAQCVENPADTITCTGTQAGNFVGDGNNETVTVEDNATIQGSINPLGGNDTVTVEQDATVENNINGWTGDDEIINDGTVVNVILGAEGDDEITNNGSVQNGIGGDDNNDTIVNNGEVGTGNSGNVGGGAGNDDITNNGTVRGNIFGGSGDDNVTINVNSTVGGTIEGGFQDNTVNGDVLTFNNSTGDADGVAALDAIAATCNVTTTNGDCAGMVSFCGNTFTFNSFEQLVNAITLTPGGCNPVEATVITDDGQQATIPLSNTTPNEIICENVKLFQTPDGFVQVYSGFGDAFPNGFLVSVFKPSDVQVGDTYNLEDPNTPAWSVNILAGNMLNVLNEANTIVGTCRY